MMHSHGQVYTEHFLNKCLSFYKVYYVKECIHTCDLGHSTLGHMGGVRSIIMIYLSIFLLVQAIPHCVLVQMNFVTETLIAAVILQAKRSIKMAEPWYV